MTPGFFYPLKPCGNRFKVVPPLTVDMGEVDPLRDYRKELDEGCAGVMPDHWEGHGRLAIRNSDVVPKAWEEKAIEKMNKIADKNDVTAERAANELIKALAEKRSE